MRVVILQRGIAIGSAKWGTVADGIQTRDIVCPKGSVIGKLTLELKVHNKSSKTANELAVELLKEQCITISHNFRSTIIKF